MKDWNRKVPLNAFTIYKSVVSLFKILFKILFSLLLLYLLQINDVLLPKNTDTLFSSDIVKRKDKFPVDCPETIRLAVSERLSTFHDLDGDISFLKKDNLIGLLSDWRDIFIKDMYLSTLREFDFMKAEMTEKFIYHKLEVLRQNWSKIDTEKMKTEGLSKDILPSFYVLFSDEKRDDLWDWRKAYQRENPHSHAFDSEIMDRVERDYPNFGDKVRMKPEYRNRHFAKSRVKARPNYTNEKEFHDPKLWEGIVLTVRNPGDVMIKVEMLRIFCRDEDEDDEVVQKRLSIPTTFVVGLGHAKLKDRSKINRQYLQNAYFNLYGQFVYPVIR